jgi:putative transposase
VLRLPPCGGAALRHQGIVVNGKKLRRLMREHDLQPKRRQRYVVTTDSDHAGLIFPDLAKAVVPESKPRSSGITWMG